MLLLLLSQILELLLFLLSLALPSLSVLIDTTTVVDLLTSGNSCGVGLLLLHLLFDNFQISGQIVVFVRRQLTLTRYVYDLLICEAQRDIFRFQISVDDLADAVLVVKTHQQLFGQNPDERHRYTFVVISLDDF